MPSVIARPSLSRSSDSSRAITSNGPVTASTDSTLASGTLTFFTPSPTAPDALEGWRLTYLGRKGRVTLILRSLSTLPMEDRKRRGAEANLTKGRLEAAFEARVEQVKDAAIARVIEGERLDVTLPGPPL